MNMQLSRGACLSCLEFLCCCLTNSCMTQFCWARIWYTRSPSPDLSEPQLKLLKTLFTSCVYLRSWAYISSLVFHSLKDGIWEWRTGEFCSVNPQVGASFFSFLYSHCILYFQLQYYYSFFDCSSNSSLLICSSALWSCCCCSNTRALVTIAMSFNVSLLLNVAIECALDAMLETVLTKRTFVFARILLDNLWSTVIRCHLHILHLHPQYTYPLINSVGSFLLLL